MLKYTILYKNGKTWNGKAGRIVDIPVADCVLMITTMPVAENSCVDVYSPSNAKWKHSYRAIYGKPKPKKRTPNPKSVTKKQKAFDEAYLDWTMKHFEVYDSCPSVKEYKKWLWEQKLANSSKFTSPVSPGDIIAYWALDSNKLKCVTIKPDELIIKSVYDKGVALKDKDGFIPWAGGECPVQKDNKVVVKFRNGGSYLDTASVFCWYEMGSYGDIVGYKAVEEQPTVPVTPAEPYPYTVGSELEVMYQNELRKITCVAVNSFDSQWMLQPKQPIKTTYTFWLGECGEIIDDKRT